MPENLFIFPMTDFDFVISICIMMLPVHFFIYYINPPVYHQLIPLLVVVNITLIWCFHLFIDDEIEYEDDSTQDEDEIDTESSQDEEDCEDDETEEYRVEVAYIAVNNDE